MGAGRQRLGGTAIMEELHQQTVKAAQDALGEDCYAALFRDGAAARSTSWSRSR